MGNTTNAHICEEDMVLSNSGYDETTIETKYDTSDIESGTEMTHKFENEDEQQQKRRFDNR